MIDQQGGHQQGGHQHQQGGQSLIMIQVITNTK